MSVTLADEPPFMGFPMRKVRDVLVAWREGDGDPVAIAGRTKIKEDPRAVVALLAEIEENGLIGEENDWRRGTIRGLTAKGRLLASATARKRTPKRSAQKVLDALLDRADAINSDPDLTKSVERIWVFGSMIDPDKPTVGDIDHVIEWSGRKRPYLNMDERSVAMHIAARFPAEMPLAVKLTLSGPSGTPGYADPVLADIDNLVLHNRLYPDGNPLLDSPNDLQALRNLHVPCKLVFDIARGGRVDDPVLPHHPESPRRADTVGERVRLPDLELTQGLTPCDARFLRNGTEPFSLSEDIRLALGYEDPKPTVGDLSKAFVLASVDDARDALSPVLQRDAFPAELQHLDGKNRFALAFRRRPHREGDTVPGWIVVDRSVHVDGNPWIHQTSIHLRPAADIPFNAAELEWARMAVLMLGAADATRLHARRLELGSNADIEIQYGVGGDDAAAAHLRDRLGGTWGSQFLSHVPDDDDAVALFVHHEPIEWSDVPPHLDSEGHACRLAP